MPICSIDEAARKLDPLPTVLLVFSSDPSDAPLLLEQWRAGAQVIRLEGATAQLHEYLDALPLWDERRLLWINHWEQLSSTARGQLVAAMEQLPANLRIGGWSTQPSGHTHLAAGLEPYGLVVVGADEKPWQKRPRIEAWVHRSLAAVEKRAGEGAVALLLDLVGLDRLTLQQELAKLISYLGDRPTLEVGDVQTLVVGQSSPTSWQLAEAVIGRKRPDALRLLYQLGEGGLIPALGALRYQLQLGYTLLEFSGSPKRYPHLKGRSLERHRDAARQYGVQRYRRGLILLEEADRRARGEWPYPMEALLLALTE